MAEKKAGNDRMTKATKTAIPEDWQPDEAGRAFADARGVPEDQVGAIRQEKVCPWVEATRAKTLVVSGGLVSRKPCPVSSPIRFGASQTARATAGRSQKSELRKRKRFKRG